MGFAGPSGIPTRHCCCTSRPSPFQCPLERPSCDRFSLRRITSRRCVLQLPRLRDVRTLCCVRPRGVGGAGWGMSPSRLSLLGVATSSVLRCRSCSRSQHRKRRILRRGLSILAKRKIVPRDLRAGLPDTSWSMRPDALASGFLSWGCRRSPLRRSRSGSPLPDSTLRPSPSDRDATPDLVPPSWFCATSTVYSSSDRVRVLHLTADLEVRPVSDLCDRSSSVRSLALQSLAPPITAWSALSPVLPFDRGHASSVLPPNPLHPLPCACSFAPPCGFAPDDRIFIRSMPDLRCTTNRASPAGPPSLR
jgi:hypothetical protein